MSRIPAPFADDSPGRRCCMRCDRCPLRPPHPFLDAALSFFFCAAFLIVVGFFCVGLG